MFRRWLQLFRRDLRALHRAEAQVRLLTDENTRLKATVDQLDRRIEVMASERTWLLDRVERMEADAKDSRDRERGSYIRTIDTLIDLVPGRHRLPSPSSSSASSAIPGMPRTAEDLRAAAIEAEREKLREIAREMGGESLDEMESDYLEAMSHINGRRATVPGD